MTKDRVQLVAKWKVATTVDLDHCFKLHRRWHELRSDLENELLSKIADESLFKNIANGTHEIDTYYGSPRDTSETGQLSSSRSASAQIPGTRSRRRDN